MNALHLCLATTLLACSQAAFAQWQWVDESGRKVFSDRPPPAHIAPHQILQQPRPASAATQRIIYPAENGSAPGAVIDPKEAEAAAKAQALKAEQEAHKAAEAKAQEDSKKEEAQRKAEEAERKKKEQEVAKARQENCQRAKSTHSTMQSGMRLVYTNEKGERSYMTEQQRQAELQRAQEAIKSNCP